MNQSDVTGLPSYGSLNLATQQFQFDMPNDTVNTYYSMTVYSDDGYNTTGPYAMSVIVTDKAQPTFNYFSQFLP